MSIKGKKRLAATVAIILLATALLAVMSTYLFSFPILIIGLLIVSLPPLLIFILIRDNQGKMANVTLSTGAKWLALTALNAIPMSVILAPLIGINVLVDWGLDNGICVLDSELQRTITILEEIQTSEPYSLWHPLSWVGVNKVVNAVKEIEVPVYSHWTRRLIHVIRSLALILQVYWYLIFFFLCVRTIGYVAARTASASGVAIRMYFST